MQLTQARLALTSAAVSLALTGIACQIDVGGPQPPAPPIATPSSPADSMTAAWQSALTAAATTHRLMIVLNEGQLTGFLTSRLEKQTNPVLSDAQVFLRQGQMRIFGVAQQGPFRANVLVTIAPVLKPDGSIGFEVASADLGPIPAPDSVRESLSAMLTEAFTGAIGSFATGFRIQSLAIANGELAIVGELR